jgi:predicted AlkP superfamily pyrophosphatase or phosphodiesterase
MSKPSVVLISIDALKPEFLFQSEQIGVELPNLKKYFLDNGTYAGKGVQSVFPTFTYPCHQSIITGTNPVKHGIANNKLFDPVEKHKGAWHWRCTKKVKTLWEAAKENGYITASASFPASAGAKGDYIAPEFWYDGTEFDSVLVDLMSVPQGLVSEMELEIGKYPNGYELNDESDEQRYKALIWLLENKLQPNLRGKPFFVSGYFASFDESAHNNGVHSDVAKMSLEKIDEMVGEIIDKVHSITNGNVVICVVSDHGTMDNTHNISPNVLFQENGLIELDGKGYVARWDVWSQRAGGISEVRLRDKTDMETYLKVKKILGDLALDEEGGVLEILDNEASMRRGGFPKSDFVIVAKKGYEIRDNVSGPYCSTKLHQKAQHGYSEFYEEMRASFMIEGVDIEKRRDIGEMKLIDIAPTLANCMGFVLEDADGENVLNW